MLRTVHKLINYFVVLLRLIFMLQPLFHIEAENIETEDLRLCHLLIVIDADSLSYVIMRTSSMSPLCIKYFQFNQIKGRLHEEILREIIFGDELLAKEWSETFIVYNFPESTFVPEIFFDGGPVHEFTELIYGNLNKGLFMSEKVPWWDMYNVYRLPADAQKMLHYKFPSAKQWHYYSLLLKSYKKYNVAEKPEILQVAFGEERMIVSVYKKGQLQLVQNFLYSTPEDVLYHLLNCCRQLDISLQVVSLQIAGFIEKQSLVYAGLLKYFSDVSFEEPGESIETTDMLKQYPLHYFTSLLKMAACV